jgi:hypothetical protein
MNRCDVVFTTEKAVQRKILNAPYGIGSTFFLKFLYINFNRNSKNLEWRGKKMKSKSYSDTTSSTFVGLTCTMLFGAD